MRKKRKVLFILPDLSGGGAERVTLDLLKYMNTISNIKADLLLLRKKGELLTDKNLNMFNLLTYKNLNEISKYDTIVGALELKSHLFASILGKVYKKNTVLWLHKDLKYYLNNVPSLKSNLYKNLFSLSLNYSEFLVTVSKGARENLIGLGFNKNKIINIYNIIDFDRVSTLSRYNPPEWFIKLKKRNIPILLAVGRLEKQKGFDLLLKSIKLIKGKVPFYLIIMGKGSEYKNLKNFIEKENLTGNVKLVSFQKNPYPIMKNADIFVLSSRYEGFPTVLVENLYLGTYSIAFDCPTGPSELLPYENLLPPEDYVALGNKLIEIINHKKYLKNLKLNKLELFDKNFILKKWMEIL